MDWKQAARPAALLGGDQASFLAERKSRHAPTSHRPQGREDGPHRQGRRASRPSRGQASEEALTSRGPTATARRQEDVAVLPDQRGTYGCAWSADASALFYITVDDAWRPYRIWRHLIGAPATQDVIVFEEHDEKFLVSVWLSRSERYLLISSASELTSEVWLRDARRPEGAFSVVRPRRQAVEYHVEHQAMPDGTDRLLIVHNDGAVNFQLAQAPCDRPAEGLR